MLKNKFNLKSKSIFERKSGMGNTARLFLSGFLLKFKKLKIQISRQNIDSTSKRFALINQLGVDFSKNLYFCQSLFGKK